MKPSHPFQCVRWHREAKQLLQRYGAFSVNIGFEQDYRLDRKLPVRESVLRAMLLSASEIFIYDLKADTDIARRAESLLEKDRGRWRLNLSKECIDGFELFWNSSIGIRGSAVIASKMSVETLQQLFANCSDPFILSNIGAVHTKSAVRFANRYTADTNRTAFCLPPNDGMKFFTVFHRDIVRIFDIAVKHCKVSQTFINCYA